MSLMMSVCNEKEVDRLLDFIPGILEESETNIHNFYKTQAKVNALYRRTKRLAQTTFMEKYPIASIDEEFSGFRDELDNIYTNLTR